ncbi:MAG TPA: hypothetical protein VMU43_03755 [Candidatus Acidoferrum sp.]|nr:hypothetical protein [Candidatus Acidoferrum sp.]
MPRRSLALFVALVLLPAAYAQSASPASPADAAHAPSAGAAQSPPPANGAFLKAADEVLQQMSNLLDLPIKEPLKKSLRSKAEIRDYLVREEKEDRTDAERHATVKTLEVFGLIPQGFPLDSFLLDVLTEQVAGLYDSKTQEFYIADWIPADEQKEVMAHELTHALEDQSFQVDPWIKAARPNDDAELARDSVSEGSALAAMEDYALLDEKMSIRDLPDVTFLVRSGAVEEMNKDPKLSSAPPFIRDELLFPYLAGIGFMQQFLKAHQGWQDLHLLFENPPVSTQQILHPQLYLKGVQPEKVTLPAWKGIAPADWKLLDENAMGEFGLGEVLKQFLGPQRGDAIAPMWTGDRYAIFENQDGTETHLVFRVALDSSDDAARFFGQYSEVLEDLHHTRSALHRRPNYFEFQTPGGGVYLQCAGRECLIVDGSTRETFEKISHAAGWPGAPAPAPGKATASQAFTDAAFARAVPPAALLSESPR